MNKISYVLLLCIIFTSCILQKNNRYDYAYNIITTYQNNDANTKENTKVISSYYLFENKLIELVLGENRKTEISVNSNNNFNLISQNNTVDTIAVQFIDPVKETFTQIDSFKTSFKVLKKGNYKESPIGLKINLTINQGIIPVGVFRDTIINNQSYRFSSTYTKDKNGADSILQRSYFTTANHFLSVFNIFGIKNPKEGMVFAGFDVFFLKENYDFGMMVGDIRVLAKEEKLICKSICDKLLSEN